MARTIDKDMGFGRSRLLKLPDGCRMERSSAWVQFGTSRLLHVKILTFGEGQLAVMQSVASFHNGPVLSEKYKYNNERVELYK